MRYIEKGKLRTDQTFKPGDRVNLVRPVNIVDPLGPWEFIVSGTITKVYEDEMYPGIFYAKLNPDVPYAPAGFAAWQTSYFEHIHTDQ